MYHIAVYYNQNKDSYYYRKYYMLYDRYDVGYKNNYGHEIVLIIDLTSNEKISLRKRIIDRLIHFLREIR